MSIVTVKETLEKERRLEEQFPAYKQALFASAYAVRILPLAFMGYFLNIFLLEEVELTPSHVAQIMLARQLWDAITDPFLGMLSDRTPGQSIGRRAPWIAVGAPLAALLWAFVWSSGHSVWYYHLTINIFALFLTAVVVPYLSLLPAVAAHIPRKFLGVTAIQQASGVCGALLGSFIPALLIHQYPGEKGYLFGMYFTLPFIFFLPILAIIALPREVHLREAGHDGTVDAQGNSENYIDSVQNQRAELGDLELEECISSGTGAAVEYDSGQNIGREGADEQMQREKVDVLMESNRSDTPDIIEVPSSTLSGVLQSLRTVLTNKQFIAITSTMTCQLIGNYYVMTNLALYLKYVTLRPDLTRWAILAAQGWMVVGIFCCYHYSKRYGTRKEVYYCGSFIFSLGLAIFSFTTDDVFILLGMSLRGVGLSAGYFVPFALLSGVVQASNESGDTNSGLYYAVYAFADKVGAAFAFSTSSLCIGWTGYQYYPPSSDVESIGIGEQNEATKRMLFVLVCVIPASINIFSSFILLFAFRMPKTRAIAAQIDEPEEGHELNIEM